MQYVRLIPPGAADVAHYRVRIPEDARGPITFTAKLNYRKFAHSYTQFAYAGEPKPGQDPSLVGKAHNSLEYSFDPKNIPKNVSGEIKDQIPDLPIVVVAQATAQIRLGDGKTPTQWKPVILKADRERWNDWGIGMLLQGDIKGAEYAFTTMTQAEPEYSDGWLNLARALIQEGETDAAKPYIQKAIELNPVRRPQLLLPRDGGEGGRRLSGGDRLAAPGHPAVSARPRGAQPARAHPVPVA